MRKHNRISRIAVLTMVVLLGLLSGCAQRATVSYPAFGTQIDETEQENGPVVENSRFRLEWDNKNKQITLVDIVRNVRWSPTPTGSSEQLLDEFGLPVKNHPMVESAILVDYIEADTQNLVTSNSYNGAVRNGRVSCSPLSDGLKVTYFFDQEEFAVPVEYRLRESGMEITIDPTEIQEGRNKVFKVAVAPFFCAVANTGKDGYLFVPSGSGALVYPKTISSSGLSYSQEMYGDDPIVERNDLPATQEEVRLPVYGAKAGNQAMCAIIESGADTAYIEARAGASSLRYSTVYASFRVRGYANLQTKLYTNRIKQSVKYMEERVEDKLTVGFYPLYDGDANYTGIAKTYREYLIRTDGLTRRERGSSAFSLYINGGILAKKSFLGVPYETLIPLTTLAQAETIILELYEETGAAPAVSLDGFGESGLNIGKIAGGYTVHNKLGSVKIMNELASYCRENTIPLFFDFDTVRFSSSGDGWSKTFDTAKGANGQTVYPTMYHVALRNKAADTRYVLLAREQLAGSAQKLISKTKKWEVEGFGLGTMSSLAYSDYGSRRTHSRGGMSSDIAVFMDTIHSSGRKLAVSEANAYAASRADHIFRAPMRSTQHEIFDDDIPFYQIVFKGYIPMSSAAVNLASSPDDMLLAAVEGGCSPAYSLFDTYDAAALDAVSPTLCSGVYADWRTAIVDTARMLKPYYESIDGVAIMSHTLLGDRVRMTVYENGVAVVVNRGQTAQDTPLGRVEAGQYRIGEAAA